jgi:hopene-associated glycosyltransferase HpnB
VILAVLASLAAALWLTILLAPWRPWSTRERLEVTAALPADPPEDELSTVTALVPARDEAAVIARTIEALQAQGARLRIIVVDDQSSDGTADVARWAGGVACEVVAGAPLPDGWVGKLWALEQARQRVRTPLTLLVDADIELRPGLVAALLTKMRSERRQLVSLMAVLQMTSAWEKLLIPAYVYFFKLLYPFRLSNSRGRLVAAAAGGCVLVETAILERLGGFGALRDALIDDCALARRVKDAGGRTWIGLTHSAISLRRSRTLGAIWDMVARSAFAQLRFSTPLLLCCVALLVLAFWVPPLGLLARDAWTRWSSLAALTAMTASYVPVLRYYGRSPLWALALPLTGTLYLCMTVDSAVRAWRGVRSRWKGRLYHVTAT